MRVLKTVIVLLFILNCALTYAYSQNRPQKETTVKIDDEIVEKELPSYSRSLRRMIKEAEKNLSKIDRQMEKQERAAERKNRSK